MMSILATSFLEQNSFIISATLTLGIIAFIVIAYLLLKNAPRLMQFIRSSDLTVLMNLYRIVLGGGVIVAFVLSIFPRSSAGMGVFLYFILGPLGVVQLGLAFLPWQRLAKKEPTAALLLAGVVGFFAFCIDFMLLQLAGYVN